MQLAKFFPGISVKIQMLLQFMFFYRKREKNEKQCISIKAFEFFPFYDHQKYIFNFIFFL